MFTTVLLETEIIDLRHKLNQCRNEHYFAFLNGKIQGIYYCKSHSRMDIIDRIYIVKSQLKLPVMKERTIDATYFNGYLEGIYLYLDNINNLKKSPHSPKT